MTSEEINRLKPEVYREILRRVDNEIKRVREQMKHKSKIPHKTFEEIIRDVRMSQPDRSLFVTDKK